MRGSGLPGLQIGDFSPGVLPPALRIPPERTEQDAAVPASSESRPRLVWQGQQAGRRVRPSRAARSLRARIDQ